MNSTDGSSIGVDGWFAGLVILVRIVSSTDAISSRLGNSSRLNGLLSSLKRSDLDLRLARS